MGGQAGGQKITEGIDSLTNSLTVGSASRSPVGDKLKGEVGAVRAWRGDGVAGCPAEDRVCP